MIISQKKNFFSYHLTTIEFTIISILHYSEIQKVYRNAVINCFKYVDTYG